MIIYKDFEDYLQDRHCAENPEILDDDLPDAYNEWLDGFEQDDWIAHAEIYAKSKVHQAVEELEKI